MSDQLDQRIRRLVVHVVDSSPQPPAFEELLSLSPRRRIARRVLLGAVAAATVVGLAVGAAWFVRDERSTPVRPAGPSQPTPTSEESGPPVAPTRLEVVALPTLKYSAEEYTVRSGTIEISLGNQGGTHTLVFDDPSLSGFELIDPSGPTSGTVTLEPGSYTIYCQIPGHRAAGMEATIVATP